MYMVNTIVWLADWWKRWFGFSYIVQEARTAKKDLSARHDFRKCPACGTAPIYLHTLQPRAERCPECEEVVAIGKKTDDGAVQLHHIVYDNVQDRTLRFVLNRPLHNPYVSWVVLLIGIVAFLVR